MRTNTRAIVTDIEGTTSSISFVKEVLFPYARRHMASYVKNHLHELVVRTLLDDVRQLAGAGLSNDEAVEQLIRWIDEDKKITPLKTLQGMIWEAGYHAGDFTGHVYADVTPALYRWKRAGLLLYVFSSGSVQAQKLLFRHSDAGDLTPLFSGYFDTTIGSKREVLAYQNISDAIAIAPRHILFLSDIREELDAARAAGMETAQLIREISSAENVGHHQARSFDEVTIS